MLKLLNPLFGPAKRPRRYFPLYPKQAEFLDSQALFRGFVGGRGCGKSKIGAYDMLCRTLPGRLYLVAAPTYVMMRDATLRSFVEVSRQIGRPIEEALKRGDMQVRLENGAEVIFRSAEDPERLRGPNLSGCWMDEASLMDREAFEIAIACLREGGEQGWLSATFTPKGRLHWTYEVFGDQRAAGVSLTHATTLDNPFLSPEFYETVRVQYSGLRARQELGGEFVDVEGAEWPPEYFVRDDFWFDQWPDNLTLRVIALDPSKGAGQNRQKEGDYSAYVLLGRDPKLHLYVEADMNNQRDVTRIIKDGLELARRFHPDGFGVESNQFQSMMITEFQRLSREQGMLLPLYGINNTENKDVRIRRLTPCFNQGIIHFRKTKGTQLLVDQLRAFPEGDHDDGPDALEMALRLAIDLWNGRRRKK